MATVQEIEASGITRALALAATRALDQLSRKFVHSDRVVILLDGNHNWLADSTHHAVVVRKKADQDCVSVAAASVVAKVHRDSIMRDLSKLNPGYGLESNKGYASEGHIRSLQSLGPTEAHRLSWLGKILGDGQLF
jgi:ribonuclease HII